MSADNMAFSAALVAGLVPFIAGRATAGLVLAIGIIALAAMPVLNVLAILLGEGRRREWPFVAATGVVIALLLLLTLAWKAHQPRDSNRPGLALTAGTALVEDYRRNW